MKPAAEICFCKAPPHASQVVLGGSDIDCMYSNDRPHDWHSYS